MQLFSIRRLLIFGGSCNNSAPLESIPDGLRIPRRFNLRPTIAKVYLEGPNPAFPLFLAAVAYCTNGWNGCRIFMSAASAVLPRTEGKWYADCQ